MNMRETESGWVLIWAQRIEAQMPHKKAFDEMKGIKDFDHIQRVGKPK